MAIPYWPHRWSQSKLVIYIDVHYYHQQGHENFNYGESASYLDNAFVAYGLLILVTAPFHTSNITWNSGKIDITGFK